MTVVRAIVKFKSKMDLRCRVNRTLYEFYFKFSRCYTFEFYFIFFFFFLFLFFAARQILSLPFNSYACFLFFILATLSDFFFQLDHKNFQTSVSFSINIIFDVYGSRVQLFVFEHLVQKTFIYTHMYCIEISLVVKHDHHDYIGIIWDKSENACKN